MKRLINSSNAAGFISDNNMYLANEGIQINNSILFENSFLIPGNLQSEESITANYQLHVVGNIKCRKLLVKQDLFVHGDMDCEKIVVQGKCTCLGRVQCQELITGGDLSFRELVIEGSWETQGIAQISGNLFLFGNTNLKGPSIIYGFLDGDGNINSEEIILVSDLKSSRVTGDNIVLLNNVINQSKGVCEEKPEQDLELLFAYWDDEFSYEEIIHKLKEYSYSEDYREMAQCLEMIWVLSEKDGICSLEEMVKLIWLKGHTCEELYQFSLVRELLDSFYKKQISNLPNLSVVSKNEDEVIETLYLLTRCQELIGRSVYKDAKNKLTAALKMAKFKL